MKTYILDRNPSVVAWLKSKGIEGELVPHVTFSTALNNHIYGPCPLGLASVAAQVSLVRLPRIDSPAYRRYLRGELSATEMDECGAHIRTYTITQTGGPGIGDT